MILHIYKLHPLIALIKVKVAPLVQCEAIRKPIQVRKDL